MENINNQKELKKEKQCYFCINNIKEIDYKDGLVLRRFINVYGKIFAKKRTGTCAKHQRDLAVAVKRARIMSLLPFVTK